MSQSKIMLSPAITLRDIFGPKLIFDPRASLANCGWLFQNLEWIHVGAGTCLPIAGELPVICHKGLVTKEARPLFRDAGLEMSPFVHTYQTEQDYRKLLQSLEEKGEKIVFNYLHPTTEINAASYWINPNLLGFLNNKANIKKLVPLEYLPKRKIIPSVELIKAAKLWKLPLVVKAATEEPNGGGRDIRICRSVKEVEAAAQYFRRIEKIVLEEYLEIKQNYCIQFAKTFEGKIIYLGAAQQVTNASGHYLGNWIEENQEPSRIFLELGRFIMEQACKLGYFGIAGFDIVTTRDNRVLAIDLNFRLNGSTPALLLREDIFRTHKASVLLFRRWKTGLNWAKFLPLCKELINNGNLIPLAIFNPILSSYPTSTTLLSGILVGASKDDILKKERLLADFGLS